MALPYQMQAKRVGSLTPLPIAISSLDVIGGKSLVGGLTKNMCAQRAKEDYQCMLCIATCGRAAQLVCDCPVFGWLPLMVSWPVTLFRFL